MATLQVIGRYATYNGFGGAVENNEKEEQTTEEAVTCGAAQNAKCVRMGHRGSSLHVVFPQGQGFRPQA